MVRSVFIALLLSQWLVAGHWAPTLPLSLNSRPAAWRGKSGRSALETQDLVNLLRFEKSLIRKQDEMSFPILTQYSDKIRQSSGNAGQSALQVGKSFSHHLEMVEGGNCLTDSAARELGHS